MATRLNNLAALKVGSSVEAVLDDACILVSLLLQHGVEPAALAKTVGRLEGGTAPASVIGAICDRLAERQAPAVAINRLTLHICRPSPL